ncbi:uncharacterized protein IWZ02DRAFT_489935 [Phyllosticta citriasiana]|uniref:uncharacterized protein n=1 Tax=Phyllosticta citriasiana TaxID=595635 RepID=UPI0030FD573D
MPSIAPYMALRRNNTDQPNSESRFREELDETPDSSLVADKHRSPAQQRARRYSLPSDGQPTPEEGAGGSPPSLEKAAGRVKKLALRAGFNSTEASQSAPPSPGAGSRSPQPPPPPSSGRKFRNPGIIVASPGEEQKPELAPIHGRDRGAPPALDPMTGNVKRPMTSLLPDASTWPNPERDGSNGHPPRPATALFSGPGGAPFGGLERGGGGGGRPGTVRAQAVNILMREYSDLMVESKLRLLSALENEEKCEILVATRGEWRRIYLHSLIVEQAMSEKDAVIQSAVRGLKKAGFFQDSSSSPVDAPPTPSQPQHQQPQPQQHQQPQSQAQPQAQSPQPHSRCKFFPEETKDYDEAAKRF